MSQDQWTQVDRYITDLLVPNDPILDAALQAATDAGLPPAQVAPNQRKLLAILAQSIGARSIQRAIICEAKGASSRCAGVSIQAQVI